MLPFAFRYLDDIHVASLSPALHMEHFRTVFKWLDVHSLITHPEECAFGQIDIAFLCHSVNADGNVPLLAKVDAVQDFPARTPHGHSQSS